MSKESDTPVHRPYVRAYDGGEEDFPTYILKVLGKDRTWMDNGSCRNHELARRNAWTCRSGDDPIPFGDIDLDPKELIEAALMICAGCPAQYQCALWAVEVREESGTWSMKHDHLLWLIRQDDSEAIIHMARIDHEPVQVAVHRTLTMRRREARLQQRSVTLQP
ncbi:MAG: WhiB family transcriptional regulator [Acidimicrobiia bacterium]|nr:WhiB family transcriptional regulator [Acidimicrobiia bacterium]